ncbi:TetR/AcrR family transcriptional regulator [Microlunatus flavus]|uniref:DNA-binding transcriptional regulator, AcrR family n=1 Tax=Microlunatus flavus TaxID=1036181 RepID=A0A1H9A8Q2_9ACTN|nr:TetR/AcrR family transcriptional regulator [Microlunatus flavus]SEP72378.1 DNA-binding transcriptional regulator, AcrR family [Microlunatus flavus]
MAQERARTGSRERLVEATRELLWQHGYSGTTPAAIRARSDVGQGSMYHHFPTKVDLAAEALRVSSAEAERSIDAYLDEAPSPGAAVARYLSKPRDGEKGCRFGRLTLDDAVLEDERLRRPVSETLTWYRQRMEALLREGQASGELRPDFSAEAVGATVIAMLQGAHVLARADRSQASYERVIEGALTLLEGLESRR